MKVVPIFAKKKFTLEVFHDEMDELWLVALHKAGELAREGKPAEARRWSRIMTAIMKATAEDEQK